RRALKGMMSAPSGEASSSSVKKIEEALADGRKAHEVREMSIRPYKAPRWKSFRLPAAKYELLIYSELLITALVMMTLKEIALMPWSQIEKLNAAIKKLNPAELSTADAVMFANELLNATYAELPCALLKVPPRTVEKCPGDKTTFDYAPLSKPSLFMNGVVRGSQLLQAYKMMCCSGQSPSKPCPCGYKLFEGYCVALVETSSEEPFANVSNQTCGPLGYVASSEPMLSITLLEHISADFNARIHLDVFYSCATEEAYRLSDLSPIPFTSLLTSRCEFSEANAFKSFFVVANGVHDQSPNNSWILCIAPKMEGNEWWHPD
uniref:Uncharacterized protein n=1 Tax=Parascaris univalens TaxID=6257 RepID=A0A915BC19_PARUN